MRRFFIVSILIVIGALTSTVGIQAQEFKIRGRLHMDAFYGISKAENFSNGFYNRRARLGAQGSLSDSWLGVIEFDFADATISATDVYIQRKFNHGGSLTIGQHKVVQGLNELVSSNDIILIERSSANNTFADSRRIGAGYSYINDNVGVSTMIYGRAMGQGSKIKSDMPLGVAARGFLSPKLGDGVFHVGASLSHENLMDTTSLTLGDRPEARDSKGGSVKLLSANVKDSKGTTKVGLELLYQLGSVTVDGELFYAGISRYTHSDLNMYGFHVQASYVINGARGYSKGIVKGVSPVEGGAWEIALRYSFVNLNKDDIAGGEQGNITLGVNYYATKKVRFMANLIYVNTDKLDANPVLGVVRAQYSF